MNHHLYHSLIRWMSLPALLLYSLMFCSAQAQELLLDTTTKHWIRETPPGAQNAAGFLTLRNTGTTTASITGVQCAPTVATRCEIHEHKHVDGRMHMQAVESLSISANSSLTFAPGGYHVMLLGLAQPLKAGSTVELVFTSVDKASYRITLPVISIHEE